MSTLFGAYAGSLLGWLSSGVILGTIAAGLAWVLTRTLLRRARPAVHAAVWLIVLIRFVMPDVPGWSFSLASLAGAWTPAVSSAETPPIAGLSNADDASTTTFIFQTSEAELNGAAPALTVSTPSNPAPASVLTWLAAAYLAVVAAFATYRVLRYARFARLCRDLPRADERVRDLVARQSRRFRLPAPPETRISHDCATPFVFGVLRPTLVLPQQMLADADELETVVLHELAHFRRGDLLARGLQCLAGTLLFFWPVVAWVNRRLDLAREQACDEWALRHGRLTAGQYARCLLKAAKPLGARYAAIRPAAMAANASHVERRIEMIMDAKLTERQSRMVRLAAGTLVLGWGGFVLSGAAASAEAKKARQDAGAKPQTIVVEQIAEGGEEEVMVFVGAPDGVMPAAGDVQMMINESEQDGGVMQRVAVAVHSGPSEADLAAFLATHPTADADGNGSLSKTEYQAYLVALAVNTPGPVIGQFPKSDRDGDGLLSANEAVRLVAGGGFPHIGPMAGGAVGRFVVRSNAAGPEEFDIKIERTDDEAGAPAPGARVIKLRRAEGSPDGAGEPGKMRVVRRVKDADGQVTETEETVDAAAAPHAIAIGGPGGPGMAHAMALPRNLPAKWIAENVTGSPAPAQVASYIKLVEEAPLSMFLEHNPDADANKDGKLTTEERDAYLKAQMSRMHQKMLERRPEADLNGDGVLTHEEARDYFKSKARAGGFGAIQLAEPGADEVQVEVIAGEPPK